MDVLKNSDSIKGRSMTCCRSSFLCGLAVSQLRGEGTWFVSSRSCLVTALSPGRYVSMNFCLLITHAQFKSEVW